MSMKARPDSRKFRFDDKKQKLSITEEFDWENEKDVKALADKITEWHGSDYTVITIVMTICDAAVDFQGNVYLYMPGRTEATKHRHKWVSSKSKEFQYWLHYLQGSFKCSSLYPGELRKLVLELETKITQHHDPQRIYRRFADLGDRLIINLNQPTGHVVEVTAKGRTILEKSPVPFVYDGQPLPFPKEGGSLDLLRDFLNVDEPSFVNICAWLIAAMSDVTCPILYLLGPPGSAKSTAMELIRTAIDPDIPAVMAMPNSSRDIQVVAAKKATLAFNNVSHISNQTSDTLCGLQSEGGVVNRQLRTDADLIAMDNRRPIMINGIELATYREDLLSRCVFAYTKELPTTKAKSQEQIKAEFKRCHPKILGVLLEGLASALKDRHSVSLEKLPRFTDAAIRMTAAEPALGLKPGTFVKNYFKTQKDDLQSVIENSPIASLIHYVLLGEEEPRWEGTMTEILAIGEQHEKEFGKLPHNPQALVAQLERLRPVLKTFDIGWERLKPTRQARPHAFFRISQQQTPKPEPEPEQKVTSITRIRRKEAA